MPENVAAGTEIVGREAELDELRSFLDDDSGLPSAFVLDGEAGIGKTTIWEQTVAAAAGRHRVLVCRPAEGEATLTLAGLVDLFAALDDAALPPLPPPLRSALDAALLRTPADGQPDQLALPMAVTAVFRALSAERPLLVAIDDVQWLDRATADVLSYVARRIEGVPFRLLVCRRSSGASDAPLGLDKALEPDRIRRVTLRPLTAGVIALLISVRLGVSFPRPTILSLHRVSGGNPFYALEIARAFAAGPAELPADGSLPVPESLVAMLSSRISGLSPAARDAALLVAVGSTPPAATVRAATESRAGLDEAIHDGVLLARGDRIAFTHPLLASVVRDSATPWDRRRAHARLAAVAHDPEQRAVHAALAAEEPDEAIASALDEAARIAVSRGARSVAAWMAEQGARLTPADQAEERRRRLLEASQQHHAAGDPARGRSILEALATETPAGPERADVLWRLATARQDERSAYELSRQSLAEAGDDHALRARIHLEMATHAWCLGDLARSAEHCRTAADEADRSGDAALIASALSEVAHMDTFLGRGLPRQQMARAIALEESARDIPAWFRPRFQLGVLLTYIDELDEARPLLRTELERATDAGDEATRAGILFRLTDLEFRAGNWQDAWAYARESLTLGRQASVAQELGVLLCGYALMAAHLGLEDETRAAIRESNQLFEESSDLMTPHRNDGTLGMLELSVGRPDVAVEFLASSARRLLDMGVGELSASNVVQNAIEALVAVGRLGEARALADEVHAVATRTQREWTFAMAARGRALVLAADGAPDPALDEVARALSHHDRMPHPFERARTLLVKGTIERRAKRWGDARRSLDDAAEIFERIGARLWSLRTAAERERLGGRKASGTGLSETERRIADLAAKGRSTQEIADALFLSPKTVAANLTRVYRKLGVRSRSELAARPLPVENPD